MIYHTQLADGLYQLSSDTSGTAFAFQEPSGNSYLVVGTDRAILVDLALREPGLLDYAERLAGKPVMLVLSHAHIDHICNLEETTDVWLHKADHWLLRLPHPLLKLNLHFLSDGETIDLGNRKLNVIHFPGHTNGSILLYDQQTETLITGDAVPRHLLYGLHKFVPFDTYCKQLESLKKLQAKHIYCCHDRPDLTPDYLDVIIGHLQNDIDWTARIINYRTGALTDPTYFDVFALNKGWRKAKKK